MRYCRIAINQLRLNTSLQTNEMRQTGLKKGGSVWSPFGKSARNAIKTAGYKPGGKDASGYAINQSEHHESKYVATFDHYHALTHIWNNKLNGVHSFYGLPY